MDLRILADTNVFIKYCRRLPLPPPIENALGDGKTERCLASVSIIELYRLWQAGRVPDNPDLWLDRALTSWTIFPMNVAIARQSVLWNWAHKDLADRIIAATAQQEKVEFWHTDTVLKKITGFPHRYFVNVQE